MGLLLSKDLRRRIGMLDGRVTCQQVRSITCQPVGSVDSHQCLSPLVSFCRKSWSCFSLADVADN